MKNQKREKIELQCRIAGAICCVATGFVAGSYFHNTINEVAFWHLAIGIPVLYTIFSAIQFYRWNSL